MSDELGPTGRPVPLLPDPTPRPPGRPAQIIALCNQKGGVGKTTTTISLGAALVEAGRRVLLLDFDPQGSLTVGLGFNAHELEQSIYHVLMDRELGLKDIILSTSVPGLDLAPANIDLSISGLLGTMFDGRTLHGREVLATLVEGWGDLVFHTVIRRTVKFSDSTVAGEPITEYAPSSPGAEAYRQLAREVLVRCPDA